jgi:8-oxo-dGTP pyrophosphatase MutT (NUDIX family)
MSYLDHIHACNNADLSTFLPWRVGGVQVGWLGAAFAERLCAPGGVFQRRGDAVYLADTLRTPDARSAAVADVLATLRAENGVPRLHGEAYRVVTGWGAPELLVLDRGAASQFGIRCFGVHLNGFVRRADGGLDLWIAERAHDRMVEPGKLDNLVAGGLPSGLSVRENLVKECAEEAGLLPELTAQAVPVGALSYTMQKAGGVKPDVMFLYDLELADDFVPVNQDGEVHAFRRMAVEEVAEIVRTSDRFKFNCNLVIIDFLIRHGLIDPDSPDYVAIVCGLRR